MLLWFVSKSFQHILGKSWVEDQAPSSTPLPLSTPPAHRADLTETLFKKSQNWIKKELNKILNIIEQLVTSYGLKIALILEL